MSDKSATVHAGDDLDGISDVDDLAWWAEKFIWAIGGILGLVFAGIQLSEVPYAEIVKRTSPEFLITASLIVYYACWIAGTSFDVRIQRRVYVMDPRRGRVALDTLLVVVGFFIVAALLVWASRNERLFSGMLGAFIIANIVGWAHIVQRVKPMIDSSREKYLQRSNFLRLEQLNFVSDYMTGGWQKIRFAAMLVMIVIVNLISWSSYARDSIAASISTLTGDIPSEIVGPLLPSFSMLLFVLSAEAWIWIKRLNVRTALLVTDDLKRNYSLTPLSTENRI